MVDVNLQRQLRFERACSLVLAAMTGMAFMMASGATFDSWGNAATSFVLALNACLWILAANHTHRTLARLERHIEQE